MDECQVTSEQIQSLMSGKNVSIVYSTLEEYGRVDWHKIKLVPEKKIGGNDEDNSS